MKGLFIPEITAEMFRNGCLESIEILMAEGEIYDIDYPLEQEPCEDAVSRQALIERINNAEENFKSDNMESIASDDGDPFVDGVLSGVFNIRQMVMRAPSVTPQPKTGHWITPVQDDGMSDPMHYQVRCSECGFDLDPQTWHMELHQYGADKFCPNCGAKMESEGEE